MRLCAVVMTALVAAVAAGLLARPASTRAPGYALGSALVWHVEVAALLFVALYAAIVTVRLAYHGMTFTHVGSRGVDIPQVVADGGESESKNLDRAAFFARALELSLQAIEDRLKHLEHAHDLVLNHDEEAT